MGPREHIGESAYKETDDGVCRRTALPSLYSLFFYRFSKGGFVLHDRRIILLASTLPFVKTL